MLQNFLLLFDQRFVYNMYRVQTIVKLHDLANVLVIITLNRDNLSVNVTSVIHSRIQKEVHYIWLYMDVSGD